VPYPENSLPGLFLQNDPETFGQVLRWISAALTTPRFWSLRQEWPDLMQETLARMVESLRSERFDPSRDMRVYVQGIVRIVCLQAMTERAESAKAAIPDGILGGSDPASVVLNQQLVRRVLEMASEECRELFRLYYLEGRDYQEIAAHDGVPVGTVKSRLFRCLEGAFHALTSWKWRLRSRNPGQA